MNKHPTENHNHAYHAYLMRLWSADGNGGCWRVRLENVLQPEEIHTFADLEALFFFLHALPKTAGEVKLASDDKA